MEIDAYDTMKTKVRTYNPENTIIYRVNNLKEFNVDKLIDAVEERIGLGNCYGCVPRYPDCIEVTVDSAENATIICDGVEVDKKFICGEILYSKYVVVSILNLPTYIEEQVIIDKLENFVEVCGPIRRKFYRNNKSCTDGTRVWEYFIAYNKAHFIQMHSAKRLIFVISYSFDIVELYTIG
ncbi:hypothetical protein LOTGIDRAFT_175951 [Lottia gigantea]|uniref:Uncharacterized protein n=1 Tax=Lottia gigantea TaxID=225164 RepID=V3Z9B4_LOTGI|nr:hypothetical protein LOTGIDRAFT_175951 [Lottia gigantea]ESO87493.1 hypothetical protein LOTGIDRAFT_175951 [Lottia gigantea]